MSRDFLISIASQMSRPNLGSDERVVQLPVQQPIRLYSFNIIRNVQICWAFSIYLEAVAILPQLVLLQRSGNVDNLTGQYVFFLGAYRALYILNWIFWYLTQPHFNGWIFGKAIPSFNFQHEHHLPGLAFEASIASMSITKLQFPFYPSLAGTTLVKQAEDAASNKRLQVYPATWPIMIFRVC
uniref:ER lumen protein-retaining receptor n=1 Tax=Lactuca sativa TaxID=4236 RepID=A0A9R1UFK0_LACSA|nr:hypothetical protein LSAT_V11C900489910 [Lactuca sativa]